MAGWGIDWDGMLGQIQGMLADVVTIDGTDYGAVVCAASEAQDPQLVGMFSEDAITATIRTSLLPIAPEIGARVVAKGKTYKVQAVRRQAHGASFTLVCVEAD